MSYESEAWFLPNCPCALPSLPKFGAISCTSTGFRTARRAVVKFVCDSLGMRFTEELNSHNCT